MEYIVLLHTVFRVHRVDHVQPCKNMQVVKVDRSTYFNSKRLELQKWVDLPILKKGDLKMDTTCAHSYFHKNDKYLYKLKSQNRL